MTVVSGVSLFNGVMLGADTRVSILQPGRRTVRRDEAQKLFPLTNTTAIGFSGDVGTASLLVQELYRQMRRGRRVDPVSLGRWLPRFFKTTYAAISRKQRVGRVDFIVGSVIPGQTNVIERQKAVELLKEIGFGNPSVQRHFVPDVLMRVLMTDPTQTYVPIPGSIAGRLCTMASPHFKPQYLGRLSLPR